VDLVALQFRMFLGRGQTDGTSSRIHFFRNLKTSFQGMAKQPAHHVNDVIVGMIVVIPQNHLVRGWRLGLVCSNARRGESFLPAARPPLSFDPDRSRLTLSVCPGQKSAAVPTVADVPRNRITPNKSDW